MAPIILGMGNPLLDISATVETPMLEKYNLKANDAILYEKEDLYDELLANYKPDYIAGGATQNSCRVAQWLLPEAQSVAFFGCVGKFRNILEFQLNLVIYVLSILSVIYLLRLISFVRQKTREIKVFQVEM